MSNKSSLIAIILLCHFHALAANELTFVYRVTTTCGNQTLNQTGFRLKGTKGIVTALHGVCLTNVSDILADNGAGDMIKGLRIVLFDKNLDLAVLQSPELEKREPDGLEEVINPSYEVGQQLLVMGCPNGIEPQLKHGFTVGSPPIQPIIRIVPLVYRDVLDSRGSPDPSKEEIKIEGAVGPGYSGAPVIDTKGKVVGVVDGGLMVGLQLGWAIRLDQRSWTDEHNARVQLTNLAQRGRDGLFDEETVHTSPGPDPEEQNHFEHATQEIFHTLTLAKDNVTQYAFWDQSMKSDTELQLGASERQKDRESRDQEQEEFTHNWENAIKQHESLSKMFSTMNESNRNELQSLFDDANSRFERIVVSARKNKMSIPGE